MEKRVADWLEKISAGSALIGLYKDNPYALAMSFLCLIACFYIHERYL